MTSDDIKQLIEELLRKMNMTFTSVEVKGDAEREVFSITTGDSHLLIGSRGAHLFAFSHLVKRIVGRKDLEKRFTVDVNDYHGRAAENLKAVAKVMGERARSLKTNVELEPMSSFERMTIHSFFEDAKDIKTESVGEGERRRVVIKYVEPELNN